MKHRTRNTRNQALRSPEQKEDRRGLLIALGLHGLLLLAILAGALFFCAQNTECGAGRIVDGRRCARRGRQC
jgi:colicin import membrane protein